MAYPTGVSVAVFNGGSAGTFFGDAVALSATVTPVLKGTNRLIHQASGTLLLPAPMTFTAEAGGVVEFQVPHVDQPGFVDGAGNAFTMWAYRIDVTATYKSGRASNSVKWTQNVQPLVGQDVIDLESVADGQIGEPVSAPVPAVTSVNGQTGAVTVGGGTLTATETEPGVYVIETA